VTKGPKERAAAPGSRSLWLAWIFTGALLAYAAAVHHGMGKPPGGIAQHWYEPTGFLHGLDLVAFASGSRVLVCFTLPAVLLAAGVFASASSAIARGIALSCVTAAMLFAFYGEFAPRPWEFFGWRGSATLWLTAACVGFAAAAPFLAASWLRHSWPLRAASYAPLAFAVVALIRNATGTNPQLKYAISPWPAVPVFGIEIGALFVVALLTGVAIATFGFAAAGARRGSGEASRRIAAVGLGLIVPLGLLAFGAWLGMFPFRFGAKALIAAAALCGVGIAGVTTLWVAEDREVLWHRGRSIAVAAALVAVPIVAGQLLARLDYYVAREIQARAIIDALERYAERESLYPDTLEDLVAAGDIETIPTPSIGFGFLNDASFRYQNFGSSFIVEFPAPRWVQCAYTPRYADEDEADGAEAEEPLDEAWSCPSEPPELW
jgi:hypothetical protein